jgi:pyruvate/2-oxoglutarate dehydrogenase complex dihydrolipoamide dehydrogenase (E3) component
VIGGGPIGSELAQAFLRLGSEVTLLELAPHILIREDADAAQGVQKAFVREGMRLVLGCKILRAERAGQAKRVYYTLEGKEQSVEADQVLVGIGRSPNVDGLNLEAVGVEYDKRKGVKVNDRLQTANPRIYAAGDIAMAHKFTHAADSAARIVIENALFFGKKKLSSLVMPWCTYTDPEVAHVGMYERQAQEQGIQVKTFVISFKELDRAIADGEEEGLCKIHLRKGTDQILGATLVARHAGEMINELTLAMVKKIGLGSLSQVIHPYPTQAEAIRKLADAYNGSRLTPGITKLLKKFLAWTR